MARRGDAGELGWQGGARELGWWSWELGSWETEKGAGEPGRRSGKAGGAPGTLEAGELGGTGELMGALGSW